MAESLARALAAIRVTGVRWRSYSWKEKRTNINKCPGLSQVWAGGICLCVLFSGHSLGRGKKTHISKIPPKFPGQSCEMLVYVFFSLFHAQYDWTTGVPDNGNEWRKFRDVPRSHPLRPLVFYFGFMDGNRRAFRLPGEGGDHFHCTVQPSPGHI